MEFGPIVATTAVSNFWTVMGKLAAGPRSTRHLVEKKLRVQLDAEAPAQPRSSPRHEGFEEEDKKEEGVGR